MADIPFRLSETPVFYPKKLVEEMVVSGQEIYAQLAGNTEYLTASEAAIPREFRVLNEADHPLFVQADFGLVRDSDGSLHPKLVEIQGFPSIYGLQLRMAQTYAEVFNLDAPFLLDGLTESAYIELLRRMIVGDADPSEVALLEVDPTSQKTQADFWILRELLGLRVVPIEEVQKRGRTLLHEGRPIRRIFNRAIVDEIVRRKFQLAFRWADDLDVEWAGHPNWFYKLSKFSLPYLRHPAVPSATFLHLVDPVPDDLQHYVLKPLYSFAGLGVIVGPTRADLDNIPVEERSHYLLQERMHFEATLDTPSGPTTVETRVMYVHDGRQLRPTILVVRTGRGKMMGVDYNKDLDWVGASAGFCPDTSEAD